MAIIATFVDILDPFLEEHRVKQPDSHTHQATPTPYNEPNDQSDWSFPLPELPRGQELVVRIHSTWGDRHYVGLTAIEVFTSEGVLASVKRVRPAFVDKGGGGVPAV